MTAVFLRVEFVQRKGQLSQHVPPKNKEKKIEAPVVASSP